MEINFWSIAGGLSLIPLFMMMFGIVPNWIMKSLFMSIVLVVGAILMPMCPYFIHHYESRSLGAALEATSINVSVLEDVEPLRGLLLRNAAFIFVAVSY